MKKISKKNKVIISVLVIMLLVVTIRLTTKEEKKSSEVEYFTTLTQDEVNVYSGDIINNTYYFIVAVRNQKLDNSTFEFTFDSEVHYEVSYENIHERKSLPIEYYLAAETDFNFDKLDDFNQYLSDSKMDSNLKKNSKYEKYKSEYKKDKFYSDYMSATYMYMVQIKVPNQNQNAVLNSVKLVEREVDKEGVEEVNDIFEVATNVKFITTSSNSNSEYNVNAVNNDSAIYYDGKIKYDFELTCNDDIVIKDVKTEKYETTNVTTYQNGELVDNSVACKKSDIMRYEMEVEINNKEYFSDSLVINLNVDGKQRKIYSPQVFAPENKMLVIDEDINRYSNYFEYKFNK